RRNRQGKRMFRRGNPRLFIENFSKTFRRSGGLRKLGAYIGQRTEGACDKNRVKHELPQRTGGDRAGKHVARTKPEDGDNTGENEKYRKSRQQRPRLDGRTCRL